MTAPSARSADAAPVAGPDSRTVVGAPSDVWVRTLPIWHVWNVGTMVVATAIAVAVWPAPVATVAATVGVAGLLVALYAAMFLRRPLTWGSWFPYAVPYAAAVMACFTVLLQLNPYCAYLEFSLYPQVFFLLYARRRAVLVGAVGLGIASVLGELTLYEWRLDDAAPHLFSDLVQVAFAFVIALWISAMAQQSAERRVLIAELERTRQDLAAAERQAGVLDERARLAREIHDTLAQGFASVVAHLEAARGSLGRDPVRVERHLDEAEDVARTSLADARGLAWALRPGTLTTGGLPAAIERAVDATLRGTAVAWTVTVTGAARALHPNLEVTLLRATQEALANVKRHAHARDATVTLSFFDDAVSLDVADDGIGFDPEGTSPGPGGGLGLLGIRERAEALGGSVAIESAAGHGTTIGIYLPTTAPAAVPEPEAAPTAGVAR